MLIAARQSFLTQSKPYDAELEYLSNGGTAYIETNLYAQNGIGFDVTFKGKKAWTTGWLTGWGNDYSSNNPKYSFEFCTGDQWTQIQAAIGLTRLNRTKYSVGNKMQTQFVTLRCDTSSGVLKLDDTVLATGLFLPLSQPATLPNLPLFARRHSNAQSAPEVSHNDLKISHAGFYVNGVIVRDFIPVRIGTTGYMYDKVSGKLFGNAGTGSFILGPDK